MKREQEPGRRTRRQQQRDLGLGRRSRSSSTGWEVGVISDSSGVGARAWVAAKPGQEEEEERNSDAAGEVSEFLGSCSSKA